MIVDIIYVCDISIGSQCVNMFSSSLFLHWCYRYRLTIDESKSETNVKYCVECIVICCIFHVVYEKK
jgi:hypothetical protein